MTVAAISGPGMKAQRSHPATNSMYDSITKQVLLKVIIYARYIHFMHYQFNCFGISEKLIYHSILSILCSLLFIIVHFSGKFVRR